MQINAILYILKPTRKLVSQDDPNTKLFAEIETCVIPSVKDAGSFGAPGNFTSCASCAGAPPKPPPPKKAIVYRSCLCTASLSLHFTQARSTHAGFLELYSATQHGTRSHGRNERYKSGSSPCRQEVFGCHTSGCPPPWSHGIHGHSN